VVSQQTAEPFSASDFAPLSADVIARFDDLVVQALMVAFHMQVVDDLERENALGWFVRIMIRAEAAQSCPAGEVLAVEQVHSTVCALDKLSVLLANAADGDFDLAAVVFPLQVDDTTDCPDEFCFNCKSAV